MTTEYHVKAVAIQPAFDKEFMVLPFDGKTYDERVALANEVCERYHVLRNEIREEHGMARLDYGRG